MTVHPPFSRDTIQHAYNAIRDKDTLSKETHREHINPVSGIRTKKSTSKTPGIDKKSIYEFEENAVWELDRLYQELTDGTYRHLPYLLYEIPKAHGGTRTLGISTIRDKVVEQTLYNNLLPKVSPWFHKNSFAFQRHKNLKDAIKRFQRYARISSQQHYVSLDISQFFDQIPHHVMAKTLSSFDISDDTVSFIIDMMAAPRVTVTHNEECGRRVTKGIPQGNILSPFIANMILTSLDTYLHLKKISFVRYADDVMLILPENTDAKHVIADVSSFISHNLNLEVNDHKTVIYTQVRQVKFLGIAFTDTAESTMPKTIHDDIISKIKAYATHHETGDVDHQYAFTHHIASKLNYYQEILDIQTRINRITRLLDTTDIELNITYQGNKITRIAA